MIIGDEQAVTDLWGSTEARMPAPREDRPGQPVYVLDQPPHGEETGLRLARVEDIDLLLPACAATYREELGVDPLERDAGGFRRRTLGQIHEGRSWLWVDDGTILFKAEASAWTPSAVQLQQVWVDPAARNRGHAQLGLRHLCRVLLESTPTVCLFVRPENAPAIRVYEAVGMRRRGSYRSILF
jgi:predicted GNAT family acetyltransferase